MPSPALGEQRDDPRIDAAIQLIHCSASNFLSYRTNDEPFTFTMTAHDHHGDRVTGSGVTIIEAMLQLAARVLDGHRCQNCDRPTALDEQGVDKPDILVLDWGDKCWIVYDHDHGTYRRECDGPIP
jgi:hypothetical protein